ncbi:amidohydrolase [Skermanella mucosa]|uniref:amidohydrolase n=1 Tax=Skermanella mucosa TaxID=1789672 RepID=UPI00192BDC33|nr:amidohydrolase [Skermanella mucosa]UEM20814.1 amidohydrolase [Skermanella mucosa]
MYCAQYISTFALAAAVLLVCPHAGKADSVSLEAAVRDKTASIEGKLIAWRRDIHQHPELGDQETRTSGIVADHLRSLGLDVRTGVARTGVVAVLKGAKPGPTVSLRADMDALPVKEPEGLPFASRARSRYLGKEVDVMHACGHDAHTAMLMATAEVLASLKDQLPGTVQFIFQPAEEGSSLHPPGSDQISGAKLMVKEGIFADTRPDAVFGLHVMLGKSGEIAYRAGAVLASSDNLEIKVTGKQGHGGMPWQTIDPITTSAQIVNGLQTIVSRKVDLTTSPAVVTIGTINGGTRANIVPETVAMTGTIRTYDEAIRDQVHRDITTVAEKIAESAGATAEVSISRGYDTTVNNDELTGRMLPALERAADGRIRRSLPVGASEDFSVYASEAPGLFVFLGVTPDGQDPTKAAPNHSPNFFVDEAALVVGARTMASLAVNYLASPTK